MSKANLKEQISECNLLIWELAFSGDIEDPVLDSGKEHCESEFKQLLSIREKLYNDELVDDKELQQIKQSLRTKIELQSDTVYVNGVRVNGTNVK